MADNDERCTAHQSLGGTGEGRAREKEKQSAAEDTCLAQRQAHISFISLQQSFLCHYALLRVLLTLVVSLSLAARAVGTVCVRTFAFVSIGDRRAPCLVAPGE